MFKTNVGSIDRILRIVVGAALLLWFFVDQGSGFWHYAKLIGIVPILTGLFATCPAYSLLGMSTCPMKKV
jgi:Na+-transporting NADH:ubiquinone oxidoreductase subunit NqrB